MQPTTLGRYRILGVLGRGGMGVVYEAHDPQIDRVVAIKTIVLDALSDAEKAVFETRFRSEMRSTGRLQHQHIAALYDAGRDGGTAYIVMECVAGSDLKRRLAEGQVFSVTQALDIAVQLLAALEFAHRHEVIHRDVKPANVMLRDDGVVKLCDFGVARLAESDATRTQGMVLGSLRYASPEQILGHEIDARTDVFSAGVLLFQLLTRELPFKGQSDVAILHRIATESAPSVRSIQPNITPEIDAAVGRALAKDPAERFASAAEFAQALGATLASNGDTRPTGPFLAPTAGATAALAPGQVRPPQPPLASSLAGVAPKVVASKRQWMAAAAGGAALLAALAWFKLPAKPAAAPRPLAQAASAALASSASAALSAAPAATAASAVPTSAAALAAAALPAAPRAAAVAKTAPSAPAKTPDSPPQPAGLPRPGPAANAGPPAKPTATTTARPADKQAAVAVPQGAWKGQLACGASLSKSLARPEADPFKAEIAIEVTGTRISLKRGSSTYLETTLGSFDARGHFNAEGQGAYKDGRSNWLVRAWGDWVPGQQLITGQLQLLRTSDKALARECKLKAERP